MKKYFYFLIIFLAFGSCSKEDNSPKIKVHKLSYSVVNKYSPSEYDSTTEYFIEDGKVVKSRGFLINSPEEESISVYEYNEDGKIARAFVNGELSRKVVYEGNLAKVYTAENELISVFKFNSSDQIVFFKDFGPNGQVFIRKYNYGPYGNVVSVEDEEGLFAEFLEYDLSLRNPLYLTKSIAVLNIYRRGHFKNMFKTKKVYPIEGDDYSVPLRFYAYNWTLNDAGLVATVEDEFSVIYKRIFKYN